MIRIAITGPESSGKTSLSTALSNTLKGTLLLEYARDYLEQLDRPYTQDDLDRICEGHLARFNQCTDPLQIIDTDFVVLKVWSIVSYGVASPTIQSEMDANHFDLHILCSPDIPWEDDPMREHPEMREELFDMYLSELTESQKPFIIVSGSEEKRLEKSCEAIAAIQSE